MEILVGITVFILGLCFGSFVNMLVYRTAVRYCLGRVTPRPYDKNRSFCDYCGRQLKWYENIPVFSWLFLKGKTKCCHKKLPLSYPVVELLTGFLFLIFYFVGAIHESPLRFILSALVASGFLLILNLITKSNGMGMGDVKLAVFMGLFLGYPKTVVAFYVAFIVGAIYGLILMIFKKANKKTQIPFGPFLILGVFVAWWFGEKIVNLVRI